MQTQDRLLETATQTLLAPYDLAAPQLGQVFGAIMTHDVDYADLYFQYLRTEGWSLEEGIVKSGSFNIDQGVGVRAIAGEKTAFAYSDEISLPALKDAAGVTRAIARLGGKSRRPAVRKGTARRLYAPIDPLASLGDTEKVKLLERLERLCRARDPRVVQVMATLAGVYEVMLVMRSDGVTAADVRPLVRLSLQVIAEHNGRREQGSWGGGGRFDYAYFTDAMIEDYAANAVDMALLNLESRSAPAGTMKVVLGPGWPGVLLHEAIGHGLEGDFNRKGSSAFTGRIGERVASRGVTVVDDGTHPEPARLAQRRRRGQSDAVHDADRERRAARLHPGQHERAPDEDAAHRQRPTRVVCAHADAAHDQHLHAGRRQGSRRRSSPPSTAASMPSTSAAARSTSPAASSCSRRPRRT